MRVKNAHFRMLLKKLFTDLIKSLLIRHFIVDLILREISFYALRSKN